MRWERTSLVISCGKIRRYHPRNFLSRSQPLDLQARTLIHVSLRVPPLFFSQNSAACCYRPRTSNSNYFPRPVITSAWFKWKREASRRVASRGKQALRPPLRHSPPPPSGLTTARCSRYRGASCVATGQGQTETAAREYSSESPAVIKLDSTPSPPFPSSLSL